MEPTPAWFIADSSLRSVGERRAADLRDQALSTLKQIFPDASMEELEAAVAAGGDLTTIVDRLLATQLVAHEEQSGAGSSSSHAEEVAPPPGPKRRVRFADPGPSTMEQMTFDSHCEEAGSSSMAGSSSEPMSRVSDEELTEQMAASGISAEPTVGSARGAAQSNIGATLGGVLPSSNVSNLRSQSVGELAAGALRLEARVIKTANTLEEGLLTDKIVTKFVIEVRQLGFHWEVMRRYSEFHKFHELLSLQWSELPVLPPKLILSQEADDVAERMMALDSYLRALLESPVLALSPLVCTFLDAIDVTSFRMQMLPRLQQVEQMQAADPGGLPVAVETLEDTY